MLGWAYSSPAIGDLGIFDSFRVGANIGAETCINWWIDQSKPPLNKA